jgi:hypothetical protein
MDSKTPRSEQLTSWLQAACKDENGLGYCDCGRDIRLLGHKEKEQFMSGWRTYGIEECEKCGQFFTANEYYFPRIRERILICRGCLGHKDHKKTPWEED